MTENLNNEEPRDYCVYLITNLVNGKRYAGMTFHPKTRWREHKQSARSGKDNYLYRSMRHYGVDSFEFVILGERLSHKEACAEESRLISEFDLRNPESGYNLTDGGEGTRGFSPSPETLAKISGERNPWFRKDIGIEDILKLRDSGLSLGKISKVLKTSRKCVENRLIAEGIEWETSPRMARIRRLEAEGKQDLIEISLENIKELYYEQMLSAAAVGKLLETSGETILTRLRKADLPIRDEGVYRRKPLAGEQICTVCKKSKPLDEFGVHRGLSNGRHFRCRECQREYERTHDRRRAKKAIDPSPC